MKYLFQSLLFVSVVLLLHLVTSLDQVDGSGINAGMSGNVYRSPATIRVGPGWAYSTPSAAAAVAKDGDIVEILAGTYSADVAVWVQNNLTIRGVHGRAHLLAGGKSAEGKGIWVIKGNQTKIENIEFSGAAVSDGNGAGIRQEGAGLTLRGCYFHDNENGILAGENLSSDIVIENTEFANNGNGDGSTHNLYIGKVRSFTLRFSYSHHAKSGHNVKTRANVNYILYNRIMDEQDGTSSYAVDIPNGGTAYLIGNLLQQGPETENYHVVSYGSEGLSYSKNEIYVVNNTFVNDRHDGVFVRVQSGAAPVEIINNIFYGPGTTL
ncbi:MAG: right-handed parallel beta-helix repeat-containing protein, partial [Anaerolineae bacterium]|nr:right-handed parallel beta-helix repeat-containing protein [Anaerolineae bacterium]